MGTAIFPKTRGLAWEVRHSSFYNNLIQKSSVPGKEVRLALSDQGQETLECTYEVIQDKTTDETGYTELQTLLGFWRQRRGNFDSFLLNLSDLTQNANDSVVQGASIGTGDGTTRSFQCTRIYGGDTENCYAPKNEQVNVNGADMVPGTDYTITNGIVTFTSAPALNAPIVISYLFYYIVRFDIPTIDFSNFSFQLYHLQKLVMVSLRP